MPEDVAMRLTRHVDAQGFLSQAGEFLGAREAEHNLMLGLTSRLERDPLMYGEPPYFAVAEDEGRVVGATLRTPPHNLILSEIDGDAAVGLFVEAAGGAFDALPGVIGPKARVAEFANAWRAATGAMPRLEIAQRIFAADHVDEPRPTTGSMRDYEPADHRELAIRWMDEFVKEAMPEAAAHPESSAELVDRRDQDPEAGFVVWEDDRPVSTAGFGGRTPSG